MTRKAFRNFCFVYIAAMFLLLAPLLAWLIAWGEGVDPLKALVLLWSHALSAGSIGPIGNEPTTLLAKFLMSAAGSGLWILVAYAFQIFLLQPRMQGPLIKPDYARLLEPRKDEPPAERGQ